VAVKSDIEIAREAKLKPIADVAAKMGVPAQALVPYGWTKAKLTFDYINQIQGNKDGKLILVTAISPTPAGEGKTTTSASAPSSHFVNRRSAPASAAKAARRAAATPRLCRWKISTCTSPATFTP
jgi:formyltetrahydrofolate synthetase